MTSDVNEFFDDAPVGEIYSERATAIEVQPFHGAELLVINTVVSDAITRWDIDGMDPAESWEQALTAYDRAGVSDPARPLTACDGRRLAPAGAAARQ